MKQVKKMFDKFFQLFVKKRIEENVVNLNIEDSQLDKWNAYFYGNNPSNAMRNLLGIKKREKLEKAEYKITNSRGHTVVNVKGEFDFQHLKDIHHHLFGQIYSWAGLKRNIGLGKMGSNLDFVEPEFIDLEMNKIFSELKKEKWFTEIKDKKNFAKKICDLYLSINNVHAFREGNGRAQNEFIRQLCEYNGYELDLQKIMEDYKRKNIKEQYISWFRHYDVTGDSTIVCKKLFEANLVLIEEVKKENKEEAKNKLKI